ncbi:unnamed protein product [Absidia cylindrospora]
MSSPYSQSYSHSSSSQMHSQVVQNTISTSSNPHPTLPHYTAATPTPTFIAQPSPSRSALPPSSASLVQSNRLPLRKRPAKDQKPVTPTQFQWQPIETTKASSSITIEPYPQRPEIVAPSFGTNTSTAPSAVEPLGSHAIPFNPQLHEQQHQHHQHQHQEHRYQDQQLFDKYHTNFYLNSPSSLGPSTQPPLPSSIPAKSIHKQQQQSAKKKHTNNTDENERAIKKTKRGRPPLSSSATKPLSSQTSTNKHNMGTLNDNNNNKGVSNNSKNSKSATPSTSKHTSKHTSMLYCLCRKPYDESQFMIACDRCEEWFHGECIDIDEKQAEFVDSYFCAGCAKASGKQTSWKPNCSNPSCQKAARTGKNQQNHLSKYCSGACGMQVARERLASADRKHLQQNGNDNDNDLTTTNAETDLTTFTTRMEQLSNTRLSLFADRDDRQRLARIRGEKRRAIAIIHIMNLKQQFLQALVKVVEQEQQANDHCGFDSRLLWEDEQWDVVNSVATEPTLRLITSTTDQEEEDKQDWTVCNQKSKRCQRHSGWIKLKTTELEQERDEQFVVLSILARERKLIKTRMNNRLDEMNIAKSLMNGTLLHYQ